MPPKITPPEWRRHFRLKGQNDFLRTYPGPREHCAPMRITLTVITACSLVVGCAKDEMHLVSEIDELASIEIRAPNAELRGGCETSFRERFCEDQYEVIGVIDVSAGEERLLTISDSVGDDQCTNVLWLRLVRLGEVGPVEDPGTLFQLPAEARIERGAGALHTVAFPSQTVRIDELGAADENQSQPPAACVDR